MKFRLLGPLEVVAEGSPVRLGGRQRRTLLAILLVHAGEAVSTDRLIDELWGDSPPTAARKTVQAHVAHLRKSLNVNGDVLGGADDGYMIRVDPEAIDVQRFESLVEDARRLRQSDPVATTRLLDAALGLFFGAALAGLADDAFSLRVEASRIEELRLSAKEDRLDALVAAGESSRVIAEAERLTTEYPLRERLWAILMLSLYHSGRQSEALRAYSRARKTLAEELGIEPSAELRQLERKILDQDATLTAEATTLVGREPAAPALFRNPYKGLRSFDEADAGDFFGRDDLVRRLSERLESRTPNHLTVLAGPSGAGKSSVLRAGLIPHLREREQRVGVMFPGDRPLMALAEVIAEARDASSEDVLQAVGVQGPPHSDEVPIVIAVDQFEELHTGAAEAEVERFLDLMADTSRAIRWVVTVRADFLDLLLSHRRLGSLLEEALILVPPLQEHEVEAVVASPARRVGVEVEPDLISAVVRDVQARPSALPLLQYALTDTFERRRGDVLLLADYERAGGISGALARRADELYASLDGQHQEATRKLFLQLVTATEEGEIARQRVRRGALVNPASDGVTARIIERFGAQRLLTFDQDPETGDATVEVAHEALMTEWPLLARWVDDARHDLPRRQRLASAAAEWRRNTKDRSYLLTGSRLAVTEECAEQTSLALALQEQQFLGESRRQVDLEKQKRTRRRRLNVGALSAGLVVVTVLAAIAFVQRGIAQAEARRETVRRLAAASTVALNEDSERAILLGLEAAEVSRRAGEPVRPEAIAALHRAVQASRPEMRFDRETAVAFSPDGDLATLGLTPPGAVVVQARFSPDGDLYAEHLAWAEGDASDQVVVWDGATHEEVTRLRPATGAPDDQVWMFNVTWSDDGAYIAAGFGNRTTLTAGHAVWEVATGKELLSVPEQTLEAALHKAVFLDNSTVAIPSPGSEGVFSYDVVTGEEPDYLATSGFAPTHLAFDPVRDWLVLGSETSTPNIRAWDMESEHEAWSLNVPAFSNPTVHPNSGMLALAGSEGGIRLLNLDTRSDLDVLRGHATEPWALSFSPDGQWLVSTARNETLVWDLAAAGPRSVGATHAGTSQPFEVSIAPQGTKAAIHSLGSVKRFDLTTLQPVGTPLLSDMITELTPSAISPDWRLVASLDNDAQGSVRDLAIDEVVLQLGPCTNPIAFSSDGSSLVLDGALLCSDDDKPPQTELHSRVIEVSSGRELLNLGPEQVGADQGKAGAAAFNPAGIFPADRYLAVVRWDRVEMYDMSAQRLITTLHTRQEWEDHPWSVAFDRTGRYLAIGGRESRAWVLDMEQIAEGASALEAVVFERIVDPGSFKDVAINSDGLLATSGVGSLRLWDVHSGEHVIQIPTAASIASSAVFTPQGDYLLYLDRNSSGTVLRRFPLDPDELIELARSRVTRGLTVDECDRHQLDC